MPVLHISILKSKPLMFSPLLSYIKEIKINFAKSNNVQMTLGLLLTQLQPFICFGVKSGADGSDLVGIPTVTAGCSESPVHLLTVGFLL